MNSESRSFKQCVAMAAGCLLLGLSFSAYGGFTKELDEGVVLTGGADMRIRMSHWDRETISPEMGIYGAALDNGPPIQYMRVRSRIWGTLQLGENVKINARVVNRVQFFSSSPSRDNNDGAVSWEFPDEVIIDKLNIELSNVGGSDWSLKLGRQDLSLGLGMVFYEGTPFDQERTFYFDGVSAHYQGEKDEVTLFAFYNNYKDKGVFLSDQNRRLSTGDTFTTGAYVTHAFSETLNTDFYYIYANVNDTRPLVTDWDASERNWPWSGAVMSDADLTLHTAGARVFGPLSETVDYSVEYAEQRGKRNHNDDLSGSMLDARLTIKCPAETSLAPTLLLQYTRFSGDDPSSADEMEGWIPLFSAYPIWREDLLPLLFNANWTNLSQYRAQVNFNLSECVTANVAYAYLRADYGELPNAAGGGTEWNDSIGHLVSAFVDYRVTQWLTFSFEAAEFMPSNYWAGGDSATWLRFQTVITY